MKLLARLTLQVQATMITAFGKSKTLEYKTLSCGFLYKKYIFTIACKCHAYVVFDIICYFVFISGFNELGAAKQHNNVM